jgi:hypothetical protein
MQVEAAAVVKVLPFDIIKNNCKARFIAKRAFLLGLFSRANLLNLLQFLEPQNALSLYVF